jgi:hypothetical protein
MAGCGNGLRERRVGAAWTGAAGERRMDGGGGRAPHGRGRRVGAAWTGAAGERRMDGGGGSAPHGRGRRVSAA